MWSILINNRNVTGNSVEKHCFVVMNVKLEVKLRFKTFYWILKLSYTAFSLNTITNTACFDEIFAYPSNECVIYGPELNI